MTNKAIFAGAFTALSIFSTAALAQTDLTMWYHARAMLKNARFAGIIEDFNSSQSDWGLASGVPAECL